MADETAHEARDERVAVGDLLFDVGHRHREQTGVRDELIDTVSAPRHAVGPELTQLFVGSEGTLGIITRATLEGVPLPAERQFLTLAFPDVTAGVIEAIQRENA